MARRQHDVLTAASDELRWEPVGPRVRAVLGGTTVLDTVRAAVVWEPRRVVCSYAVPEEDLAVELARSTGEAPAVPDGPLSPAVPFGAHTSPGEALDLRWRGRVRPGAAFRPDDPDLSGLVVLDFEAFASWWHEDEQNVGHPRDPFHRIDVLPSSRSVRVELDGEVVARTRRPVALFEAQMPLRSYVPREDVLAVLTPTGTKTVCAYKGWASYWSITTPSGRVVEDAAWSYEEPTRDVAPIRGAVCFDDARVRVVLDEG